MNVICDPLTQRMYDITAHGGIPFDVPFMTEIAPNLWQGGCRVGLLLPEFIKSVMSLYPWERYRIKNAALAVLSETYIWAADDVSQDTSVFEAAAAWVSAARNAGPVLVHCFPPGTLVGGAVPVPIESAIEVTGHDGRLHKVTYHHERWYEGDLIVLKMTGALPIRCTPEHPFLVVRPYYFPGGFKAKPGMRSLERVSTVLGHYADQPVWLRADKILRGDYVVSPQHVAAAEPTPITWPTSGVGRKPVGDLIPGADTAWMLGLYAADGGITGGNGISFTLSPRDDLDRLVAVWRSMGVEPKVTAQPTYTRVAISSRTVRDAMLAWCGKSSNKRLPGFLFRDGWPLDAVVEGYAAGDGYVNSRGAVACRSISLVLVEQIRAALVSLGESPTVSAVKRHSGFDNAKPIYEIQWNSTATQHQTAWWRGHYLIPVTGIDREPYSGTVHNLAVADAETFTVNGVTTHNCQAGLNRSSVVVALTLMRDEGLTGAEAIDLLRTKRSPACLCNPAFESFVRNYAG